MTAPGECFKDRICPAIITRGGGFKNGGVLTAAASPRLLDAPFLHSLNCSNAILSRWRAPAMAARASRHQSLIEGGTSLAGEDRGEGGWNRLDDAVERELLRLSGWGQRAWEEREWQVGWGWGERREWEHTDDKMNEKVNMRRQDNKRQQREVEQKRKREENR